MGQLISTEVINGDLINSLIKSKCIHTINVEKVFRSVDRGLYHTKYNKAIACMDFDWHSGDVHLSAPSVYATVLECLDLHKGHKFLNIGSGIGYFSTLAGLLLGVNGVNHGIEICGSLVDKAYKKLQEFKQNSAAIDYFEFCEPVFIKGNACELLSVGYYDRVYCGAGVPPAQSSFMKGLIKIGGVLVMPLEGFLVKVIRNGEYSWKTIQVMEVSIPDLVVPEKCSNIEVAKFPIVKPLSLQMLCRSNIRASIRDYLIESHPGWKMCTRCKSNQSYDQNIFSSDDPISQFTVDYDATKRGLVCLRTTVDEFGSLNKVISDLSIREDDGYNGDADDDDDDYDDDDDDDDDDDNEKKNTSPVKPENSMRMNTSSSSVTNLLNSQSTNNSSDLWETMSSDSSEPDDSARWELFSFEDRILNSLVSGEIKSDSHKDIARELIFYRFLNKRNENELSKLLRIKINLLPVPAMLKLFLNYENK